VARNPTPIQPGRRHHRSRHLRRSDRYDRGTARRSRGLGGHPVIADIFAALGDAGGIDSASAARTWPAEVTNRLSVRRTRVRCRCDHRPSNRRLSNSGPISISRRWVDGYQPPSGPSVLHTAKPQLRDLKPGGGVNLKSLLTRRDPSAQITVLTRLANFLNCRQNPVSAGQSPFLAKSKP
jgi:hypothetical protein